MAISIYSDTLTGAWLDDLEYLHDHGGEQLNLVTTIGDPDPCRVDERMIAEIDAWLLRKHKQRIGTVANTIFPSAYLRGSADRQQLYDRYLARLPRLRKQKGNRQGTYFGRLIEYPASSDVKCGRTINQIEEIIQKLQRQVRGRAPKRFAYQAQIFVPGRDGGSLMGFPCLSFVSFQLDRGRLCLTATYRNQYYFARALGNFIGLARLQSFVAQEVGLAVGSLTIHACHAEIDTLSQRETEELIRVCGAIAPAAVAA
jgi:thymidylate synthase